MNWNKGTRQVHRWLSVVFPVAVIVNMIVIAQGQYVAWVGLLAVAPLALLLPTGLYLFALPYVTRWRGGRATG
ncbi:hypothetical protein [Montanilutibacter psychrotolerans]|uniref:Uncharacterized protein n=1 Tax=Montanilutibacter psychrotolerans TaxID=1327343 RepID=A0A3M8T483_9GAMM|nr:hypothetical protein [Lysobacter psychrotolerans]RNF86496.1 hypothetical protein EER27_03570 [Lysobacter psychrotolerans]